MMRSISSLFAVSMTIGIGVAARRRRQRLRPSSPGSIRSSTIRTIRLSASTRSISRPSLASETRHSFASRYRATSALISRSSSTTRMWGVDVMPALCRTGSWVINIGTARRALGLVRQAIAQLVAKHQWVRGQVIGLCDAGPRRALGRLSHVKTNQKAHPSSEEKPDEEADEHQVVQRHNPGLPLWRCEAWQAKVGILNGMVEDRHDGTARRARTGRALHGGVDQG